MAFIRKATVSDAVKIAPNLRPADRRECLSATGRTPEDILPLLISAGEYAMTFVGDDGEPVGIYGVDGVDNNPKFGIVWMVTTPAIYRYKRWLIKEAPKRLKHLHKMYPLLGNHIDARNTAHIRWLRWLGFSFLRLRESFGHDRTPFYEFARLRV